MSSKLNPQQEMFCREYMIDFNATQAAVRAEYSAKTANVKGSQLLALVSVQTRLSELMQERCQKLEINANYILSRLYEIDQLDILDILNDDLSFKELKEWPKAWRISLSAIDIAETQSSNDISTSVKKIKWPDKTKNLELLGKHVDVNAFTREKEVATEDKLVDSVNKLIGKLPN